ncbi:basic phospholipase A2 Sms-N6-like isoform X2 [Phasianus colchicus]|uniref:basic phospholipase A2 Sms-N6-like isoform X2 n=1 Tax=Phasianus colchicus TaxID=9054 RepID=UPI00129E77CB|nr:basic phospholipase A2 Sms-N6-like isoform X2 [Phasianus colchicus]
MLLPSPLWCSERKMKVLLMPALLLACGMLTARGKHPHTFAPGLEGSTVANLTAHGCGLGWGRGRTAFMDRCCLLRACCYAKLAARRCRVGQTQRLAAPRPGVPACSSGTRCQRAACRCERLALLCRARSRALRRCRGRRC